MRRIITASLATMALAIALPAAAQAAVTLQPGAYMETDAGSCTLNFAYSGGGNTYLGTAAHCVTSIGQPVRDIDGTAFGTVAFIGNADVTEQDFAFIAVDPEDLGRVSAAVKGYPQYPKGSTVPGDTLNGDSIQLSGYGLGYDTTPATQEERQAIMGFDNTELYDVTGPIHWATRADRLSTCGPARRSASSAACAPARAARRGRRSRASSPRPPRRASRSRSAPSDTPLTPASAMRSRAISSRTSRAAPAPAPQPNYAGAAARHGRSALTRHGPQASPRRRVAPGTAAAPVRAR